jgi:dynein heavy chain
MFAPLEETLNLLVSYDQEMPEEVHVLLEVNYNTPDGQNNKIILDKSLQELPQQWRNLKLASEMVRQQVAPFRAVQQEQLKRRIAAFEQLQVRHFEKFRKSHFFRSYKVF